MQRGAAEEVFVVGRQFLESVEGAPERALLVATVALAVVLLAVALWNRLDRTPGDRFVEALATPETVAVLMHPNPDPDAMGSAMGVVALAEAAGTDATIKYPGEIRHPENRAFETVLDCSFERIESASELAGEEVVLVDHNEPRGFAGANAVDPYAVVDHHPGGGDAAAFTDVRPDRGSCAGILTEYLRERGWSRDDENGEAVVSSRLATGLLYGIQSDTAAFTRGCTPAEFEAAAYLFPAANTDLLDRIAHPEVDGDTLDVKAQAITRRRVEGSFLISNVGEASNLDALPTAAEELLRLEGVTVSVVMGESDGSIHFSGRSRDDRVHMGRTLKRALEPVSNASAGGHARMGGGRAELPLSVGGGVIADGDGEADGDADGAGNASAPDIESRLFAAMNGEL
jgi:nanoRNase/pAp phosphatase (c-di-AMP/oligoRNAs hydrolase)